MLVIEVTSSSRLLNAVIATSSRLVDTSTRSLSEVKLPRNFLMLMFGLVAKVHHETSPQVETNAVRQLVSPRTRCLGQNSG
jgi:hypothetical protein